MARNKLKKYNSFIDQKNCFSYNFRLENFESSFFRIDHINILELCAGYGEYSLSLARMYKDNINTKIVAVDIAEDRLLQCSKKANFEKLNNLFCLSTDISRLDQICTLNIDYIYLIHPDPQINSQRKRLNNKVFIDKYLVALKVHGLFVLVTDNIELYEEFLENLKNKNAQILFKTTEYEHSDLNTKKVVNNILGYQFEILATRYNQKFINEYNKTKVLIFKRII